MRRAPPVRCGLDVPVHTVLVASPCGHVGQGPPECCLRSGGRSGLGRRLDATIVVVLLRQRNAAASGCCRCPGCRFVEFVANVAGREPACMWGLVQAVGDMPQRQCRCCIACRQPAAHQPAGVQRVLHLEFVVRLAVERSAACYLSAVAAPVAASHDQCRCKQKQHRHPDSGPYSRVQGRATSPTSSPAAVLYRRSSSGGWQNRACCRRRGCVR